MAKNWAVFIGENSAFVSQSALYGYIKTRAGLRYFRMFEDAQFTDSVNIAKWNIYAACVGDLAMFCGAHLHRHMPPLRDKASEAQWTAWMGAVVCRALPPRPPDASDDYARFAEETRQRVECAEWATMSDDESAVYAQPGGFGVLGTNCRRAQTI